MRMRVTTRYRTRLDLLRSVVDDLSLRTEYGGTLAQVAEKLFGLNSDGLHEVTPNFVFFR
jgi:hypothetical protein